MKNNPLNSINTLARTGLMRTTIFLMIALTALVTPAKAQVVGSRQELIVAYVKRNTNQQLPHDDGLAARVVSGCSTEIDRYFVVWDRELPGRTEREFVNAMGAQIEGTEYFGFMPESPSIAKAAEMANGYTETIRQRTNELRLYPDSRTRILDDIVQLELHRCILLVVARMPIPPPYATTGVALSSNTTTATGAATAAPVLVARVFNDAAAAAAAVTAQPSGFDKYADDPLDVRSSNDIALDHSNGSRVSAEIVAAAEQYPVPQCSDSDDRAAFAQCLKLRNEALFKRTQVERAVLDRERPNISSALYGSLKVKFGIEMYANLARDSCAKLASSTAPCNLLIESGSRPDLPSRVIARDGRKAMDCVKLEQLTRSNSSTGGGGSVLSNQCTDTVTIGWCSTGGECERGLGNVTNVLAGRSWPVDANHEVRWGACHGANTLHGDPGSKGLQFTCSAPETDQ